MTVCEWQPFTTVLGDCALSQTRWLDTENLCGLKVAVEVSAAQSHGTAPNTSVDKLILETSDAPELVWSTCFETSVKTTEVLNKTYPVDFGKKLQRYLRWRTEAKGSICFRVLIVAQ